MYKIVELRKMLVDLVEYGSYVIGCIDAQEENAKILRKEIKVVFDNSSCNENKKCNIGGQIDAN